MEEVQKRNKYTDCVYFLASPFTCKKGIDCEYRHCEIARLNPRDCWYWLAGNCINPACGFRHPPLDGHLNEAQSEFGSLSYQSCMSANKISVPCFFDFNGFCNKGDRCSFLHGPECSAPDGISSRIASAVTDALPTENKALTGDNTGSAATERCPNLLETSTKPAVVMSIQTKDDLLQSAPRSIPRQSASPQMSLSEGEEAAAIKSDLEVPKECPVKIRSNRCTDWNSRERVNGYIELDRRWESSPGFDVLVDSDNASENLGYYDDPEYLQAMNRKHRGLNSHFLGFDLENQVEYGLTYPDAELLYERQMYCGYDCVDGCILDNVRETSIFARERVLDSLFSRKRKFLLSKVAVIDCNLDLRDYLRKCRAVDDHCFINSSRKHESCRFFQRQERPQRHVIGQRLHRRWESVVGKNYIESYGDNGTLSNGANQREWLRYSQAGRFRQNSKENRLAKLRLRSSEISKNPVLRERRSTDTSTAFTGPKTLAEIKEEKKIVVSLRK
ncbi:zinc finger CCCH domain-containing protein 32-like [Mangifera indica]|uniref:zinc finger CCCH domain-containing protein 32-like n=1 Tax=Mangifera indica TaxID=29780 RepID=UPI001CFAB95B|nr:zinc finger CCCH domain-containing protein 32-like [Mangifera indica]